MTTFALVHGSSHGMWQWAQLIAEFDREGQPCVCVDLPVDDPSCGILDYAAVAAEAFAGIDDLVIVGHSLGGRVIPFLTETLPVRGLIFLAGAVQEGVFGAVPEGPTLLIPQDERVVGADGLVRTPAPVAERYFYHDVPPGLRAWASAQLRPQSSRALAPVRLPRLDSSPAVAYIVCADDRALSPTWQRAVARRTLRVQPHELPGGHSPFLTRPGELAQVLTAVAGGFAEASANG